MCNTSRDILYLHRKENKPKSREEMRLAMKIYA